MKLWIEDGPLGVNVFPESVSFSLAVIKHLRIEKSRYAVFSNDPSLNCIQAGSNIPLTVVDPWTRVRDLTKKDPLDVAGFPLVQ